LLVAGLCDWIEAHTNLGPATKGVAKVAAGGKMKPIRFSKVFPVIVFMAVLWSQKATADGTFLTGDQADIVSGWLSEPFTPLILPGRGYRLYVPSALNNASNAVGGKAGKPVPLLVMLHGCNQSPETFAAGTGMNGLAEKNSFLVLYPNQDTLSNAERCWNWFDSNTQHKQGEAAIIMKMVDRVRTEYNVDKSRIYVAGLSAGGGMASILASCYPEVFSAAAIHSGIEYEAATTYLVASEVLAKANGTPPDIAGRHAYECHGSSRRLIPVIVFHGSADTRVIPKHGEQVIQQFAQTNDYGDDGTDNDSIVANPTSRANHAGKLTYTVYDYQYAGQLLMRRVLIHGMGHAWSGGKSVPGDEHYDGNGPAATAMIWNFFNQHIGH
jgi:poly(hydroxyalkanoate) depolymerase family esterase